METPLETRGLRRLLPTGRAATRPDLVLDRWVLVGRFHCRLALGGAFGSGLVRLGVRHRRRLGGCLFLCLGRCGFGILLRLCLGGFGVFLGLVSGSGVRLGFGLGRFVGGGLVGLYRLGVLNRWRARKRRRLLPLAEGWLPQQAWPKGSPERFLPWGWPGLPGWPAQPVPPI
jgi:hypothetical protein